MSKKALVAMSGGVDSSVAAYLAKEMGLDAVGVTMRLFDKESNLPQGDSSCCTPDSTDDARKVAEILGIPYYVVDFQDNFKEKVIDKFIRAYESGATPNPCIECNRHLKFNKLMDKALELNCDYVITGHYARVEFSRQHNRYLLKKAKDLTKDQSYVLYSLTQRQLSRTLFPLGEMTKEQTRKIAENLKFENSNKKDSQDICFVPNGDYAGFIEEYTGKKYPPGDFADQNGNVLGTHRGIIRYTIGQRKGLGLALPRPMYVKEKDIKANKVILCTNDELFSKELYASDINLIACDRLTSPVRIKARVRYNQQEQWAVAEQIGDDLLHIEFEQPQRAISKGQAVVLYDGDIVVGGGTIN